MLPGGSRKVGQGMMTSSLAFDVFLGHLLHETEMLFDTFCSYSCFCMLQQVLPHDSKARRLFVTSDGLKKVQEIKAEPGSALAEYINAINNCYPEEIVK